jgi:hypothetical protein
VVSEVLGHGSVAITGDIYSDDAPSMMEQAMSTVAGLIFGR